MTTKYSSFKEIDERLKILELQREIHIENLKLNLNRFKTDLSPSQFFGGFKGTLKQLALTFAIKKLSNLFRKDAKSDFLY